MRKKKIILLSLLILLILVLFSKYFIPKNIEGIAHFVNQNSIEVTTDEKLNIDLIRIDLSISTTDFKNVEIFNKSSKSKIPKAYGENDWNLFYGEKHYGTIRHFKTNNWHDHDYFFHFYESENEIKCDIKINGPDENNLTIILDKI